MGCIVYRVTCGGRGDSHKTNVAGGTPCGAAGPAGGARQWEPPPGTRLQLRDLYHGDINLPLRLHSTATYLLCGRVLHHLSRGL